MYCEYRALDEASNLAIEGLALEMVAACLRTPDCLTPAPPRWLEQAREILHAKYIDGLDVAMIAKVVDVHPAHLVRAFRRHYRCSMGEYVRTLRIEFACRELTLTDSSLAEVALAAGFSDQSHFSRTFKAQIGMTPGEFQKAFRRCKCRSTK